MRLDDRGVEAALGAHRQLGDISRRRKAELRQRDSSQRFRSSATIGSSDQRGHGPCTQRFAAASDQPGHATSVCDLDKALAEWDTNRHLFTEAGGVVPAPGLERPALLNMLLADVRTMLH